MLSPLYSIFIAGIKNRCEIYEALERKDNADRLLIKQQSNRIAAITKMIQKFQENIAVYETGASKDTRDLTEECNFFQNAYKAAKKQYFSRRFKQIC